MSMADRDESNTPRYFTRYEIEEFERRQREDINRMVWDMIWGGVVVGLCVGVMVMLLNGWLG